MSGLFKGSGAIGKLFGRAKKARGQGPGSEGLTGIDPSRAGQPTSAATGQARRTRGGGSGLGGGRGGLGANTIMSRTY
jgi:hypothetical protein